MPPHSKVLILLLASLVGTLHSETADACSPSGWVVETDLECLKVGNSTAWQLDVVNECSEALGLRLNECMGTCPDGIELDSMTDGVLALSHPNEATYDYTLGDSEGQVHLSYHENPCPSDSGDCAIAPHATIGEVSLGIAGFLALAGLFVRRGRRGTAS